MISAHILCPFESFTLPSDNCFIIKNLVIISLSNENQKVMAYFDTFLPKISKMVSIKPENFVKNLYTNEES